MFILLISFILAQNEKSIEVRYTDITPKIDGFIEEIWHQADSISDFVQFQPYESRTPSETTVVYVLQDQDNLYIAFRCRARTNKILVYPGAYEDYVSVCIDPIGSRKTAYYFKVTVSGVIDDGMMLDGGSYGDASWDGVWYRGTRVFDDRYEVEIKIPFKSVRFNRNLSSWAVNFSRYEAANRENESWIEILLREGLLISKFGNLNGIKPQVGGYYFELFPEAFMRYDKVSGEDSKTKPSMSMNFKWDVTSHTTLNATVLPDFAQIESDPYTLNLSRYPPYLKERRPFFIEGFDIFKMPNMGMGTFQPIQIFYSRRIGKSMGANAVPIIAGAKFTDKYKTSNIGLFGACTDEYRDTAGTVVEPRKYFGVARYKRAFTRALDIGLLADGAMSGKDDFNCAGSLDAAYQIRSNSVMFQGAASDRNGKRGWAMSSAYAYLPKGFMLMGSGEITSDSFDVEDIGYMPWTGRKEIDIWNAYWGIYRTGAVRDWSIGPGVQVIQESGSKNWSKVIYLRTWPTFINRQDLSIYFGAGPYYEADTNYVLQFAQITTWQSGTKSWWGVDFDYSYRYNYSRSMLAYQGYNEFWGGYRVIPSLSPEIESYLWVEWDTANTIQAMTLVMTPEVTYSVSRDIELRVFDEIVAQIPETHVTDIALGSNRLGFLFSWNFQPKSWFYVAVNDYRERVDERMESKYFISAIKVKYLFYF